MKLFRQPLIQFLLIGGAIGLFYGLLGGWSGGGSDREVTVSAGEIARLEATWQAQWNRPPTPRELDGLINAQVRERVLYKEALAMGLGDDDPVVRRVIAQKLELLYNDLVELSLSPTDQELREFFAANGDDYRPPPRITMTQIFFNPDTRQESTLPDAEEMLADFRERGATAEGTEDFGDSLMLQSYYPEHTEAEIARLFGAGFAVEVMDRAAGEWHGPILSGYGVHVIYVHDRVEPPMPAFEAVEERVRNDWATIRRRELSEEYVAGLLDRYEVIIEQPEAAPPVVAVDESR
jgi:peptidyl-prolyl cis-trans isomerase C